MRGPNHILAVPVRVTETLPRPVCGRARTTTVDDMSTSAYATVLAWQDALSSGDTDTLLQLSSEGIEIAGDHGGAQGLAVLDRWATETHTTMSPQRLFVGDDLVVSETVASGSVTPFDDVDTRTVAVAFRIVDDQVSSVFVHPDLASAFAATGLEDGDLVED